MRKIKRLDYFLFFIVISLLVLGLSFLATTSAPASLKSFGTTNYYWVHQCIYGVLPGLILGLLCFLLPLGFIRKVSPIFFLLSLVAMIFVFLPMFGLRFWGASRWISIGSMVFQPSEFLKITAILYLSSWLKNRVGGQSRGSSLVPNKIKQVFIPFLIYLAVISIIFIMQPDISTLGMVALTSLVIYFSSGTPKWQTILIIVLAIVVLFALVKFEPYRLSRLTTFLNPEADPLGKGFQFKQAQIAIGSGGLGGRGMGMSSQKFGFLPQSMTDSTFAVIAEETGFIGSSILISLFLLFAWTGFSIVRHTSDQFSRLLALGVTFWIVLQGFVNISAMIGLVPLGGIPLPFVSYGGSHLVSELIGVGLLLNVAKNIRH